ncbi:FHA domain-containing protein [Microbispora sp. NPDC046933]|uniref:FHA domain-containing protein n=1 Tax=Microbispora sp. NPDC046933 TaxID=3155618 RepID=UPI0033EF1730
MTEQGVGVVRPLPGEGVVAHLNGLLLVCATGGDQPVEDLLGALSETATTGGDGRALARRVAQVLARAMDRSIGGEPVACAVAGPAGGGVAVLVSGAAYATVSGGPDGEVRLAGHDALTWTDRLVNGPVSRVELRLPGAGPASSYARLDGGVVTGAGLECDFTRHGDLAFPPLPPRPPQPQQGQQGVQPPPIGAPEPIAPRGPVVPSPVPPPVSPFPAGPMPGGGPSPEHAAPSPGSSQPLAPPPVQPPSHVSQPLPPLPPALSDPGPVHHSGPQPMPPLPEPAEDRGAPLHDSGPHDLGGLPHDLGGPDGPPSGPFEPVPHAPADEEPGEATQMDAAPEPEQRPMVYGVDCKNDHFNDPRAPYCAVCGIPIDQRAVVPYKGPRPQLGVLLLDDGMALPLEADYLLGRDPERAPEVQSGEARPARVTSPDGSVSRRHLRVFLDNWDVNLLDLGSVNGTQIQPPGDPNFYDIPPNEPVPILPGTTVRVGVSRTMRYEPHRSA